MTEKQSIIDMRTKLRAEVWGTDMDRYVLRNPFIEIENVLIDVNAFMKTRSGCDMCGNCCWWGTSVPEETAKNLTPHIKEIGEKYIPAERRDKLGWHFANEWNINYTNIVKIDNDHKGCCFLYKEGDRYLCSIYAWTLETKRDPVEYWPFECNMYPISIIPYNGILHEGKTLLTLRMPESWHIVDIYGQTRPLQRSILKRIAHDLQVSLKSRLQKFGLIKNTMNTMTDCYFKQSDHQKTISYVYYEKQLKWYFGEDFYNNMCNAAKQYLEPVTSQAIEATER